MPMVMMRRRSSDDPKQSDDVYMWSSVEDRLTPSAINFLLYIQNIASLSECLVFWMPFNIVLYT